MDNLHAALTEVRSETNSTKDHLTVFREFLAQLDELQRKMPVRSPRIKSPPRRTRAWRTRES